jgi:imidazole glycerol phosphate synthase subunit HisF
MLYKRLIPKIVVERSTATQSGFRAITTRNFIPFRVIGEPISQIKIQQSNLIDELMLVHRNRGNFDSLFLDLVSEISKLLSTPLTVGGAVANINDAMSLFERGVDKIVIGRNRDQQRLLNQIVDNYGKQSLVISVDYQTDDLISGIDDFIRMESLKGYFDFAGEISLNNISLDGSRQGVDLQLIGVFSKVMDVPLVVGSGVGSTSQIAECFEKGAAAVSLGTFLSNSDQSIKQIRSHLNSLGVHIRIDN